MKHTSIVLMTLISLACSGPVLASEAMAKADGCLNCHAVDSKKVGPAFKDVAAKYKGKADAEATLYKHVTTGPMVKVDGKEERHEIIKSKDDREIKNAIAYILSR